MKTYSEPRRRTSRDGWWSRTYDAQTQASSWVKIRGARTKRQARQDLEQIRRHERKHSRSAPFEGALADWQELRFPKLTEKSQSRYGSVLARWKTAWGRRPVASVTTRDVERYHAGLRRKGLGGATRNLERTLLRGFFDWAIARGLAAENPARTLVRDKEAPQDSSRALDEAELARLLVACREPQDTTCVGFRNTGGPRGGNKTAAPRTWTQTFNPPPWLYPLVLLGARTLLRAGTLRELRWEHVDLPARMLRIPGPIVKNREPLEIPLSDDVLDLLRRLDEENRSSETPSLLIFPGLPDSRGVARVIQHAALTAKIRGRVGCHSLRKSGATALLNAGVPLKVVQVLGGWKTPEVLLKHYQKVGEKDLRQAVDHLSNIASGGDG